MRLTQYVVCQYSIPNTNPPLRNNKTGNYLTGCDGKTARRKCKYAVITSFWPIHVPRILPWIYQVIFNENHTTKFPVMLIECLQVMILIVNSCMALDCIHPIEWGNYCMKPAGGSALFSLSSVGQGQDKG